MFPMSNQKKFILLRGLTRESRHWGDFVDHLKKQFPNSSVLLLDLPGSGKMNKISCPLTVKEMVEMLRSQIPSDELGKSDFHFVGMSLGGMVALEWAKSYPQDLSKVIVINSSSGRMMPFWRRLRPGAYPYLIFSGLMKEKQHELIFKKVCQNQDHKARTLESWRMIQETSPVSFSNALRQIFSASRFKVEPKLKVPGLVLTSYGDELVSFKCSEKLAEQLKWPIKIHSWGGHELSDDDPDWVITKMKSFID